jgi:hypothetical protein
MHGLGKGRHFRQQKCQREHRPHKGFAQSLLLTRYPLQTVCNRPRAKGRRKFFFGGGRIIFPQSNRRAPFPIP